MDGITSQVLESVTNSDVKTVAATTCDEEVTIKQEIQDIADENFEVQSTISTGSVISDVKMDYAKMYSFYKEGFNLKDCFIRLEKCDKIWETLKVIKNLQLSHPNETDTEDYAAAFQDAVHSHSKPSTPEPMQYHPVLNNGNAALPNFQFAIKSWKRLYTCTYCGKQYTENRNLKLHMAKVHSIFPVSKKVPIPKEVPQVPLNNEISRPLDIPRSKEIPRPKEVSQTKETTRPKEISQPNKNSLKPQVCQTCGKSYVDSRSVASHSLRVHGILTEYHERWLAQQENPNDYTVEDLLKRHSCKTCGKRYSCMKSLRLHYLREHNVVIPMMRGGRSSTSFMSLPKKTATHSGDMQKHMNVCNICGKKYTKNWYLRVHSLEVHGIPMPYGRVKSNIPPKLRVIKKEIIEEPPVPKEEPKLSPVVNSSTSNQKHKLAGTENLKSPIIPARVLKMYQCTTCKKEFISISKLRTHCFSRHGIVIPRLRKPYRKSNSVPIKAEFETKIKLEEKKEPQVSTPKQISMDRYLKSSPSGGSTANKISSSLPPPQSGPIKEKVVKQIVPPRETVAPTESAPASGKVKSRSKEKVSKVPTEFVKCNLCSRACKDIRKHYIAYHKIRYPESVLESPFFVSETVGSTATPAVVPEKEQVLAPEPEMQERLSTNRPTKKRRRRFFTMMPRKRRRTEKPRQQLQSPAVEIPVIQSPVAPIPEIKNFGVQGPKTKTVPDPAKSAFKCTICDGYYASARSLKIHRDKHKSKGETRENIHLIKHHYKNGWKSAKKVDMSSFDESAVSMDMDMDADVDVENDSLTSYNDSVAQSSSSESRDSNRRSTRSTSSYTLSEITCECGRSFRDPHTLFMHKEKCRTARRIEREKSMVTRSSSDRDSGIGISITIKKKNDSYEIVSRDSGDDDKSKDSITSKEMDQMSRSSDTNSSSSVFNGRKYPNLVPAQCSKDHSILKIQENGEEKRKSGALWRSISANMLRQWQVKLKERLVEPRFQVAEDDEDVDVEDDSQTNVTEPEPMNADILEKQHESIGSESRMADPLDVDLYRCATCLELFQNEENLRKHMTTHEKRPARQECPCGKTFRGAQSFLTHVQQYHPLWLQCGYCDANFLNSKEYYAHSCDVNQGKDFQDPQEITCSICQFKVKMVNFDAHVKREHLVPQAPYLCYYCQMRFFNGIQRRAHLTKDHTRPSCKVCGKILRFDFVGKHEAYHDGLGYPCHICKKAFSSMKLANSHKYEVHVREDEECKICKKVISRRHMKYHVRMHSGKDSCKICHKGFHNNRSLQDHIHLIHANDYPFVKCDNCQLSFTSERYLKRHFHQGVCKNASKGSNVVENEEVEGSQEEEDVEVGDTEEGETEDVDVTEEVDETQEVKNVSKIKATLNKETEKSRQRKEGETLKKVTLITKTNGETELSEEEETVVLNVSEDVNETEEIETKKVSVPENVKKTKKPEEILVMKETEERKENSEKGKISETEVVLKKEDTLEKDGTSQKKETEETIEKTLKKDVVSENKKASMTQENSDLRGLVETKEISMTKEIPSKKHVES